MKARYFLFILFVLFVNPSILFAQSQPVNQSQVITLDDALNIAFKNSPDLRIAVDEIIKARGGENEARANFNPRFNAEIDYVRQGPPIAFENPSIPGQRINIVPPDNTIAKGTFYLPLDISKRLAYVSNIAKYNFQIDYLKLMSVAERLIYNVKTAYYDVIRAMANQETVQASVDNAEAVFKDASAKFAAGTVAKFDVTRADTQLTNFQTELIAAKDRVLIAKTNLNKVMGIDVNTPIEIVKGDPKAPEIELDIAVLTDRAFNYRPEIRIAQAAVQLNNTNIKLQQTGNLPQLNLAGTYTYNANTSGFSSINTSWNAMAILSFPIWDGGITNAKVQQARAEQMKSVDTLAQTKLGISQEVRNAAIAVQDAQKRVESTEKAVKLAEEALRLAQVRYEAGIAIVIEVTDANTSLSLSRLSHTNALYDYYNALAALERATSCQPEINRVELITIPVPIKKQISGGGN